MRLTAALLLLSSALVFGASNGSFPDPSADGPKASGKQTAVFAGGCFWGVEAVFENVKGVSDVVSGYAGGPVGKAHYEQVSTGTTGHAESVQVTYDPTQVSYGQLLKVFFAVAHDPTEMNRQGPDTGPQYRSAIFFANDEQKRVADAYIAQLNDAHVFKKPIVTQLTPLKGFYAAEAEHQDFLRRNPTYPYIVVNDQPKVDHLKRDFPALAKGK